MKIIILQTYTKCLNVSFTCVEMIAQNSWRITFDSLKLNEKVGFVFLLEDVGSSFLKNKMNEEWKSQGKR